jgi:hypothetical protein
VDDLGASVLQKEEGGKKERKSVSRSARIKIKINEEQQVVGILKYAFYTSLQNNKL